MLHIEVSYASFHTYLLSNFLLRNFAIILRIDKLHSVLRVNNEVVFDWLSVFALVVDLNTCLLNLNGAYQLLVALILVREDPLRIQSWCLRVVLIDCHVLFGCDQELGEVVRDMVVKIRNVEHKLNLRLEDS